MNTEDISLRNEKTAKFIETKVRLTKINERIPLNKPLLIVLDSDRLKGVPEDKIKQVIHWLDEQELRFTDPDIIVPCVLILGSYDPSPKDIKQLVNAGGIFHAKSQKFDQSSRKEKIQWLKDEFLTVPPELDDPSPLIRVKNEEVDLSVYEDPPFQLSDEDWKEYLKRLNDPDRDD